MAQEEFLQYIPIQPRLQEIQGAAAPVAGLGFQISLEMLLIAGLVFGALVFLFYVITLHRAVHASLKNSAYIKDLYAAVYVSDQLKEYMIAFAELTQATDEKDLINARTQIFNFLNRIARQICESNDESLAIKLADAFFSKIEGRYVKMTPIPEGVVYFRTVAEILLASDGRLFGEMLVRHVRRAYKQGVERQKRIIPEMPAKKTKPSFGWPKKQKATA